MTKPSNKKALITGILGQDGPFLAKLLLDKGYSVYGMLLSKENADYSNTDYLGVTDKITFVEGDLTNEEQIRELIRSIEPDEMYNLAAQSFVGDSWQLAKLTTEVNSLGVLYILTALRDYSPKTKFFQASTSEMFGNSSVNSIQDEETPFHPRSPYAISKLYAYWITNNFKESYGMFCCNGIMFNHESPIRGIQFVTRKISDGVARIKLGLAEEIRLGNLDSQRDWGFAGDYVQAMWLMLQQEKPDNFIMSTGKTHSIADFLDAAFNHVGIADWKQYITIDPKFKRPAELLVLQGSSDKAKRVLGWKPECNFQQLVEMMVDADLKRLSQEGN